MNTEIVFSGGQYRVYADDRINRRATLRGAFSAREDALSFRTALMANAFHVDLDYRARNGKTYHVDTIAPFELYPLKCTAPGMVRSWKLSGHYHFIEESEYDLIEPLPDPAISEAALVAGEVGNAIADAATEINRARLTLGFPAMRSAHEGFAILMEELDELKAHVWMNQKKRDITAMRAEAVQVAAMALCFAAEVCNEETGRK